VDAVLVDPLGGAGLRQRSTIPEDVELVALWIGQQHPRDIALPNINNWQATEIQFSAAASRAGKTSASALPFRVR
jgi:hypothetical protein